MLLRRLIMVGILITAVCTTHMQSLSAQDNDLVTIPNLTGLTVPQAAAQLNRNGLRLGAQLGDAWTEAAPVAENTIATQSVAAGEAVPYGTTVDITVLTTARIMLFYDDNDITLVNQTGAPLNTATLIFRSSDGTKSFPAQDWTPTIGAGDCGQLWSVTTRRDPKRLAECDAIQWQGTNDTVKHFWTELAGVEAFDVFQGNVLRASCPAAPAGTNTLRCVFFFSPDEGANTEFLYFVYTSDRFSVVNPSSDRWMPITTTPLLNMGTQQPLPSASSLFDQPSVVADPERLAPGQCLLIATETDAEPPQACDVAVTAVLETDANRFWQLGFLVDSITDNEREPKMCPPADLTRTTVCIITR